MRTKGKAVLSFFLALLILIISVNLPVVAYTDYNCQTQYESFVNYAFPCGFLAWLEGGLVCLYAGNVQTITLSSATLYAGYSATASSNATSSFKFSLNNPQCTPAHITSLEVWNVNQTAMITNWNNSTAPSSAANYINFTSRQSQSSLVQVVSVTSFSYYPEVVSGPAQAWVTGKPYNYVINFDNGQSVSGTLIAQK
jgi:hypothetical protein